MAQVGGKEAARDGRRAALAIEETARWIDRQIEHVWCALGVAEEQGYRKLEIKECEKRMEYEFVHKGKVLAKARSYFSYTERQWKFELMEVDQEYYLSVKEYFTGRM